MPLVSDSDSSLMRTVGTILKQARDRQRLTRQQIALQTKIKERFLVALEEGNLQALPNYSIAQGFARSYARVVGVDPGLALALLRRDFPQETTTSRAKEMSLSGRPVWTPRTTIVTVLVVTLAAVTLYLVRQYILFVAPPFLEVNVDKSEEQVLVSGKTSPSATVQVDNKTVLVEKDGTFRVTFAKSEIGETLAATATSRSGKETTRVTPVTSQ